MNGGTGSSLDSLAFSTHGTVTAAALAGISHIEKIVLGPGGTNGLILTDAPIASTDDGHVLTVLGNSGTDNISAVNVTTASDTVRFEGLGGADHLYGGGGIDKFVYVGVPDSTGNADGTAYDTLVHFNVTAGDRIDLPNADHPTSVATVSSGSLSAYSGSFDTDMNTAIGSQLAAHSAVDFHVTAGNLSGHEFLVVNPTGTAGYVSGADYVFDITGHTGTVTTTTLI